MSPTSADIDQRITLSGTGTMGLFFRYQDANNYVGVEVTIGQVVRAYKVVAGVETTLGTGGLGSSVGQVMRVVAQGTRIQVYLGTTASNIYRTLDTTDTSNLRAEQYGISITSTAARVDDWRMHYLYATSNIDELGGYALVTWTNNEKDATWVRWEIWRSNVTKNEPNKLIATITSTATTYKDWLVEVGSIYKYMVRQVATRDGTAISSADTYLNYSGLRPGEDIGTFTSESYWLIHPTNDTLNVLLSHVTSDNFTDEDETEELKIIGRGRKVDYGTYYGPSGSLSAQVWDRSDKTARAQRQALMALKRTNSAVYLRNPFGDLWLVNLGNISYDRTAGVGTREHHNVTIPYYQVA